MNMSLFSIADILGASIDLEQDMTVSRVCIDSRAVQKGDLFFCIVGQRLDGHEFARQAVEAGACAVVASAPLELSAPVLLVRDTTLALGRLARAWRERTTAKVIGVSGSAGKTTVKEMLAQILSEAGTTAKNFRNLNNQIGLPLSMLEMSGDEDFWVLELGISRSGDMDELGYVLAPDAALLINIGPCHLEGLGSLAGVAEQKSILLDHVRPNGFACINADHDELVRESSKRSLRRVTFSGTGNRANYTCVGRNTGDERISYTIQTNGKSVALSLPGTVHVSENVAAVTAMALELGLSPAQVEKGLSKYAPVAQRFVQTRIGSWVFIDDTYNANPVSMRASIQEAEQLAVGKRLVLILADMRELGCDSVRSHHELGEVISQTKASHVFFHGRHAGDVQSGLSGFAGVFRSVTGAEEVLQALVGYRAEQGVLLFKGSRGCKMENYYSFLERNWA